MRLLDVIFLATIIAGVIAAPFVLFFALPLWMSRSNERPPAWRERVADVSTSIFIASVLIGLCVCWTSVDITRDNVVHSLAEFSDNCHVSINGKPASNSAEILAVLRSLASVSGHHSNPTKKIGIKISDKQREVLLTLARDSGDAREYWVFYPKYCITAFNEIGRIKTPLFDAY